MIALAPDFFMSTSRFTVSTCIPESASLMTPPWPCYPNCPIRSRNDGQFFVAYHHGWVHPNNDQGMSLFEQLMTTRNTRPLRRRTELLWLYYAQESFRIFGARSCIITWVHDFEFIRITYVTWWFRHHWIVLQGLRDSVHPGKIWV